MTPLVAVIEISGLPSAGKSTLAKKLLSHYRGNEENLSVRLVGSDEVRSPILDKLSPSYNIWHTCEGIKLILEAKAAIGRSVLIFDRGLIDSFCWMRLFYEKGKVTSRDLSTFEDASINSYIMGGVDYHYFNLNIGYDCAISRGKKRNGFVGRSEYLDLARIYSEALIQVDRNSLFSVARAFNAETDTTDELFSEIVGSVRA